MKLSEFDYDLPDELIAQRPIEPRTAARLLVSEPEGLTHARVSDLPAHLRAGDLLVFNDTRVIPARLQAKKQTGGAVEVLLTQPLATTRFLAMLRNANRAKPGTRLHVASDLEVEVEANEGGGFYRVQLHCDDVLAALDRHGHIPLPPYIRRADDARDRETYQTMFARAPGSSAAPTAGLHFTPELLAALDAKGVRRASLTLHVGPGTFLPVREEAEDDVRRHRMHAEVFELPGATADAIAATRAAGGRIVAVGTTSARTLESVALWQRGEVGTWGALDAARGEDGAVRGQSELFITPGFPFQVVDVLLTNFHLPRSTLLMLVTAFLGRERARAVYAAAISERYRFFSYGDASLLTRAPSRN